jgi:hypothetical protein
MEMFLVGVTMFQDWQTENCIANALKNYVFWYMRDQVCEKGVKWNKSSHIEKYSLPSENNMTFE